MMSTSQLKLKINQEYVDLLPKLSAEEYESLKQSIKKQQKGLRFLKKYPIIVNNQGVILDGYYKYRACQELGLESKLDLDANVNRQGKSDIQLASRVEFNRGEWLSPFKDDDKIQEILFIINSNLRYFGTARNQFQNKFQRVELGIKIRSILQKIVGSEYVSLVGPKRGAKQIYMAPGRADQELGKFVGVGRETIRKVWIILHNATEEEKQQVRSGQMSIIDVVLKILSRRISEMEANRIKS